MKNEMEKKEFLGFFRAEVIDNEDPLDSGRVKIRVIPFMEETKENSLPWAIPMTPYGGSEDKGIFFIPDKADVVWVFFENGDILMPVWFGASNFKKSIPSEAKGNPANKVIKTKEFTIEINDKDKKLVISAKTPDGIIEIGNGAVKQSCNNFPNCLFTGVPHSTTPNVKV